MRSFPLFRETCIVYILCPRTHRSSHLSPRHMTWLSLATQASFLLGPAETNSFSFNDIFLWLVEIGLRSKCGEGIDYLLWFVPCRYPRWTNLLGPVHCFLVNGKLHILYYKIRMCLCVCLCVCLFSR